MSYLVARLNYVEGKNRSVRKSMGMDGYQLIVKPDYMGAAEFEFGSIPTAWNGIVDNIKDYILTEISVGGDDPIPVHLICHKDNVKEVSEFLDKLWHEKVRTKCWTDFNKSAVNKLVHGGVFGFDTWIDIGGVPFVFGVTRSRIHELWYTMTLTPASDIKMFDEVSIIHRGKLRTGKVVSMFDDENGSEMVRVKYKGNTKQYLACQVYSL